MNNDLFPKLKYRHSLWIPSGVENFEHINNERKKFMLYADVLQELTQSKQFNRRRHSITAIAHRNSTGNLYWNRKNVS